MLHQQQCIAFFLFQSVYFSLCLSFSKRSVSRKEEEIKNHKNPPPIRIVYSMYVIKFMNLKKGEMKNPQ